MDTLTKQEGSKAGLILGSVAGAVVGGALMAALALVVYSSSPQDSGPQTVEQAMTRCVDGGTSYYEVHGKSVSADSITKTCLQVLKRDGDQRFINEFASGS